MMSNFKGKLSPPPTMLRPLATNHEPPAPKASGSTSGAVTPPEKKVRAVSIPVPQLQQPPAQPVFVQEVNIFESVPQPYPAAVGSMEQKKESIPIHWMVLLAAAVLLFGWGLHYQRITRKVLNFVPTWELITATRDFPEQATVPDWDAEITPDKLNTITHGKGLKLVITKNNDGGKHSVSEQELMAPTPSADPDLRTQQLGDAKKKMEEAVNRLNAIEVPPVIYDILVDSSSGDPKLLTEQLKLRLNSDLVAQTTNKGYRVKILFHRLGESGAYNLIREVDIAAHAPKGDGQSEIEEARDEIIKTLHNEKRSELVFGILNTIYEDRLVAGCHVLVFSDGLEFSDLFKWEDGKPTDVARDKWNGIFMSMEDAVPNVPKLDGVIIDWYLPNRAEKTKMMIATTRVWKEFLTARLNATMEEHF